MGIFNKLRNELIDIVQWMDDSPDTMVWRFPRYENEIKYGAKLIVREGQAAAFVNEGKLADVFQPGTYTLQTQNLPILSTLKGWKYGFESPFKAEVYFVSTRVFTDRKWGTKNPIMLRDAEFGPVRLRAFGTYAVKVDDPATFLRQLVGTNSQYSVEQINDQLRDLLTARFADVIGESKIPILDLAGNYDELGKFVNTRIEKDFAVFGVKIVNLLVENISLPAEVEAALDKRSSMGIIGNLSAYSQYQAAQSMETAAANPSGLAGAGVGMGVGYAMASQMTKGMGGPPSDAAPPPLPNDLSFFAALDGQQSGPFNMAALAEKIKGGQITRETLVWKNGMVNWTEAGKLPELNVLFGEVPPPLPAKPQ
jgi:membrane protease subunit (stomatin/prohibitin family)